MLPIYDSRPIREIKLPISKEIVKIKPYTVAQEQRILEILVDVENKKDFLLNIKQLLSENVEDDINIDDMFLIDMVYLNMKLRAISKSEMLAYQIICDNPECKKYKVAQPVENEIEDVLFVRNSGDKTILVKVDSKLTVELQPAKVSFLDYLVTKDEINIDDSEDEKKVSNKLIKENLELALVNIAFSIKRVIFDEKIYNDFTIPDLLEKILSNLTEKQIKHLQEEKNKLANLYIKIENTCSACGKKFEKVENDFFVLLT